MLGQVCNHRNEEVRPVPKGPTEPGWPWQERCLFVFLETSLFLYCSHPAVQQPHSHLQWGSTSVLTRGVGAEEEGCACTLWPLCFVISRWHQGLWLASSGHCLWRGAALGMKTGMGQCWPAPDPCYIQRSSRPLWAACTSGSCRAAGSQGRVHLRGQSLQPLPSPCLLPMQTQHQPHTRVFPFPPLCPHHGTCLKEVGL